MEAKRGQLVVDRHSLSIGFESVGLPTCVSYDVVIETYIELLGRVRRGATLTMSDVRSGDVDKLADAIGSSPEAVANQISRMLRVAA